MPITLKSEPSRFEMAMWKLWPFGYIASFFLGILLAFAWVYGR